MFNCDNGNLEELKQIPKNEIPSDLIVKLEDILINIESNICENIKNNDCKYSLGHFLEQKYRIKSCISYLNKIK
jgi:hypothetical protein